MAAFERNILVYDPNNIATENWERDCQENHAGAPCLIAIVISYQRFVYLVSHDQHQEGLVYQEDGADPLGYWQVEVVEEARWHPPASNEASRNKESFGRPAAVMEVSCHLIPSQDDEEYQETQAEKNKTHPTNHLNS